VNELGYLSRGGGLWAKHIMGLKQGLCYWEHPWGTYWEHIGNLNGTKEK
jgi:hypothetical protein